MNAIKFKFHFAKVESKVSDQMIVNNNFIFRMIILIESNQERFKIIIQIN